MTFSNINSSNVDSLEAKWNYMKGILNVGNNDITPRSRQRLDIEEPLTRDLNHKSVNLRVKFYEVGNPQIQYKYEEDGSIWKTVNIKRKDEKLSLSKSIRVTIPIKKIIFAAHENKSITELNYKQIKYRDENLDINELYNITNLFIPNSGGYIEQENVSQHDDRYDTASEHSPPSLDEQPIDVEPRRGSDGLSASEPPEHDDFNYDSDEELELEEYVCRGECFYIDRKTNKVYQLDEDEDYEVVGDINSHPEDDNELELELELEEYVSRGECFYIDRKTNKVYQQDEDDDYEVVGDINSHPEDEEE